MPNGSKIPNGPYDTATNLPVNAASSTSIGGGSSPNILIAVATAFAGGISWQPILQTASNTDFGASMVELPPAGWVMREAPQTISVRIDTITGSGAAPGSPSDMIPDP